MKKRLKGMLAVMLILVLAACMMPASLYNAVAEEIWVDFGETITAVSGNSYVVVSGNNTILNIPGEGVTMPELWVQGYGKLLVEEGADTASVQVTDSLYIDSNAYVHTGLTFTVNEATKLRIGEGIYDQNDNIRSFSVLYDGRAYPVPGGYSGLVLGLGRTIAVTEAAGVRALSGVDPTVLYPCGETVTATYEAMEGYYFPENYAVTGTNGKGSLSAQISDDLHTLTLTYTLASAMEEYTGDIAIQLAAATAKSSQEVPAGLGDDGAGGISGTTRFMEYAASAEAAEWLPCTEGTTVVEHGGTWYVRYGETNTQNASPAAEVKVMEDGSGSVTVPDLYYGQTPEPVISSETNGTGHVTIEYKAQGTADTAYSETVPTAVGAYTIRVTFPETGIYREKAVTTDFSIGYLPVPENPHTILGTLGENGFYTSEVTIAAAEGYLISETLDGTYTDSLTYTYSQENLTLYYMEESTGAKTDGTVAEAFQIDGNPPMVSGALDGGLYYADTLTVSVGDENLSAVTVNREEISFTTSAAFSLPSNDGLESYTIVVADLAGNEISLELQVAAPWMEEGIISEGTYKLYANWKYTLDSGSWTMNSDSTVYTGGMSFYVINDGEYTFTRAQE